MPSHIGASATETSKAVLSSAGHVQDGAPTAAQLPAGPRREAAPDLVEQLLSALQRHRDVAGEGAQQLDICLGVVVDRPVEVLDGHDIEQPGRLDLGGPVGQFPGCRARRALGKTLADSVVDLLDVGEEGVPPGGKTCSAPQVAR